MKKEVMTMAQFAMLPENQALAKKHMDKYLTEHPEALSFLDGGKPAYQDIAMWVYLGYTWEDAVEVYIEDAREWAESQYDDFEE